MWGYSIHPIEPSATPSGSINDRMGQSDSGTETTGAPYGAEAGMAALWPMQIPGNPAEYIGYIILFRITTRLAEKNSLTFP